jgi:hypothetical protein
MTLPSNAIHESWWTIMEAVDILMHPMHLLKDKSFLLELTQTFVTLDNKTRFFPISGLYMGILVKKCKDISNMFINITGTLETAEKL